MQYTFHGKNDKRNYTTNRWKIREVFVNVWHFIISRISIYNSEERHCENSLAMVALGDACFMNLNVLIGRHLKCQQSGEMYFMLDSPPDSGSGRQLPPLSRCRRDSRGSRSILQRDKMIQWWLQSRESIAPLRRRNEIILSYNEYKCQKYHQSTQKVVHVVISVKIKIGIVPK